MKVMRLTLFLCIVIILQFAANVILWMISISARECNQIEQYTDQNGIHSLSFVEIGNPWPFGDNEVEVHAIQHGPENDDDKFYFRIKLHNTNDWSALPTLRFEETIDGVNFYVTQGKGDGETKYVVIWDNVFPSTNTQ